MRSLDRAAKFLPAALLCLLAGGTAAADTIVLKNGRRILAISAVEEGTKVRYQTSAGELVIPKSIVDHIEKGGFVPMDSPAAAANLAITAPASQPAGASSEIERGAVHDGAVDRQYISGLEGLARDGRTGGAQNAGLAHHAAAQFELSRGDLERALADERAALSFTPQEPALLTTVAYVHLRRSEYKQSLEYLERARRLAPENPEIPKLSGWAYYGLNKLDQAVLEWKRALALGSDPEVAAALEKAERDKHEEENYKENESSHFTLRYSGAAEPALARDVLRTLEAHFTAVESELSFSPPDSIGVILYTRQAFADITRAPGWAGAVNDGRIRVPVQGLSGVTPELSRVLKHELTHSFVQQKTRGLAPAWIQEGLAQWMEGRRSRDSAAGLIADYDNRQAASLGDLEGSWMELRPEAARDAYDWSLANMEFIISSEGLGDVLRILDRIATGASAESALQSVLRSNYEELAKSTREYLQKTYGR